MKLVWLLCLLPLSALAEDGARPPEPGFTHPSLMLEWDNARPEQRQALDQFYQSLERPRPPGHDAQRMEREQHFERLREMSPEQRQQQFRDFVQNPPPPPPPPPPGMMMPPVR
ncbi:hypothetical protein [Thalassolituus marinus]|uniref:DUF3106 domain-containing protein n=1 Tax=Thalassolituus marinus TaxID=671053 RepID=A0ABS7ZMW2_9GAMM|nr:hypothetical protein [Thalassolituus marinus]MCA6063051.1 hypothetical protein [Thalassolituus marinus]